MPDIVVLEALGPRAFYMGSSAALAAEYRTFFPGNRITTNAIGQVALLPSTQWRLVADYNTDPYPPPGWPAPGSIPATTGPAHPHVTSARKARRAHSEIAQ